MIDDPNPPESPDDYNWFVYQARPVRVISGDTLELLVDLGFGITREIAVSLRNIETHEIYGVPQDSEEFQKGVRERDFVDDWLAEAKDDYDGRWPLVVRTVKQEGSFGEYAATVLRKPDERSLRKDLKGQFDGVTPSA